MCSGMLAECTELPCVAASEYPWSSTDCASTTWQPGFLASTCNQVLTYVSGACTDSREAFLAFVLTIQGMAEADFTAEVIAALARAVTTSAGSQATITSVTTPSSRRSATQERLKARWKFAQDFLPELSSLPLSDLPSMRRTSGVEAWVQVLTDDASSGTVESTIASQVADNTLMNNFISESATAITPSSVSASSYAYFPGYSTLSPTPSASSDDDEGDSMDVTIIIFVVASCGLLCLCGVAICVFWMHV